MFRRRAPRLTTTSSWRLVGAAALLLFGLTACATSSVEATPALPASGEPTRSVQERTVEELWAVLDENYVYEDFHGIDWAAVYEEHAGEVSAEMSTDEVTSLIDTMLADLPEDEVIWQTRAERLEQETQSGVDYQGIGVYVGVRGGDEARVILLSVLDNSPAALAGLKEHDAVLAIDGEPVGPQEGLAVVERIRGPANSDVALTVRSPGEEPREVVVTRTTMPYTVNTLQPRILTDEDIGYVLFPPAPYDEMPNHLLSSLQTISDGSEVEGLVLDMRVATAESGWPLGLLLALFGDGELGTVVSRAGEEPVEIEGQDIFGSQDIPLVIIVGPDTGGPIEIFAAAMQSVDRAMVVGLPTPGNVELLTDFMLPDGSRARIATETYRTVDGVEIGREGITPDVMLELDWDDVTPEDDPVRDAAVEALLAQSG